MRLRKLFIALLFLISITGEAQRPAGFEWVDLKQPSSILNKVRQVLKPGTYTDIIKIGVLKDSALVIIVDRNSNPDDGNEWMIFNVNLSTGQSTQLVDGYKLHLIKWIGPQSTELAIDYLDCWGCEPAKLFTTIYFKNGSSWVARWMDKPNHFHPGAIVYYSDEGEDDPADEQIFSVIHTGQFGYEAGSWQHRRDYKTKKFNDSIVLYLFDPISGKENIQELKASEMHMFEKRICDSANIIIPLTNDLHGPACKTALSQ